MRAALPGDRLGAHPDIERAAATRPELQDRSERTASALDVESVTVYVWDTDVANLFVFGTPDHGHVVVSTATLEALTEEETVACIGHELAHVRNIDLLPPEDAGIPPRDFRPSATTLWFQDAYVPSVNC